MSSVTHVCLQLHSFSVYCSFCTIAPDAPPSRPQVVFFTSTSLALTWQAPPLEHVNGIIRRYTVGLREVDTGNSLMVYSYSTNITIHDLHPHFTYTFMVRAETISPGPYSPENSIQLEEDGKRNHNVLNCRHLYKHL